MAVVVALRLPINIERDTLVTGLGGCGDREFQAKGKQMPPAANRVKAILWNTNSDHQKNQQIYLNNHLADTDTDTDTDTKPTIFE